MARFLKHLPILLSAILTTAYCYKTNIKQINSNPPAIKQRNIDSSSIQLCHFVAPDQFHLMEEYLYEWAYPLTLINQKNEAVVIYNEKEFATAIKEDSLMSFVFGYQMSSQFYEDTIVNYK